MGKDQDQVYRLTDMEVREVGFVDRAANKRRFLVVKRSDDMGAGAEVVPGKDGALTATSDDKDKDAPQGSTTEPTVASPEGSALKQEEEGEGEGEGAPPAAGGEEGEGEGAQAPAGVKLTQAAKDMLKSAIGAVADGLSKAVASIEGAEVVEELSEMKAEGLLEQLVQAAGDLQDAALASLTPEAAKSYALLQAKRLVKADELRGPVAELLEKYGSKMKKERLARFQQAMSMLGDILVELTADRDRAAAEEQQAVEQREKALQTELGEVKKQLEEVRADLSKAQASRSASNAIPVEKGAEKSRSFSWPTDMNRPPAGEAD